MDDDGDLHQQILHIEAHIEELADVIESCRKIILISKAAIAAGGTLILAIITGAVGFDPTVMIGAIAAVIGGTVVFGSNTSTLKQTTTAMKAAEAHRAELIQQNGSSGGGRGGGEVNAEVGSSGSGHQAALRVAVNCWRQARCFWRRRGSKSRPAGCRIKAERPSDVSSPLHQIVT
jgi:hypothetical protein